MSDDYATGKTMVEEYKTTNPRVIGARAAFADVRSIIHKGLQISESRSKNGILLMHYSKD